MTIAHNQAKNNKVAVALSGGVDSAVAAYLLKQQGYEVHGFFMKNWSDDKNDKYRKDNCPWIEDYEDIKRICNHLEISYHTFNFEEEYRARVFQYFLNEYEAGRTPNPDILCNTEIKFKSFLKRAEQLGFNKIATGHYARVAYKNEKYVLQRGVDQSYFIYHLNQEQLSKLLFPIGDLEKSEVRKIAEKANLPVAKKKDSQGLCFIGNIDFPSFLEQYIDHKPGPMKTVEGEIMGEHKGLEFYTIGQRYGINIGGTGPYYVVDKDQATNTLIICQGADHPSLLNNWFTFSGPHWINDSKDYENIECSVRVRYRSPDVKCKITGNKVELKKPERAITPGQFAVFYNGLEVLGGAIIEERDLNLNI